MRSGTRTARDERWRGRADAAAVELCGGAKAAPEPLALGVGRCAGA
jgi:hypothetical protein